MAVAECGDPEGLVSAHAPLAADAEVKIVDEPGHDRQDLFAREAIPLHVLVGCASQLWQPLAEPLDLGVLLFLAPGGKARVVEVLNAPGLVYSYRLEPPVRRRGDTHLFPGRRNHQLSDPLQVLLVR